MYISTIPGIIDKKLISVCDSCARKDICEKRKEAIILISNRNTQIYVCPTCGMILKEDILIKGKVFSIYHSRLYNNIGLFNDVCINCGQLIRTNKTEVL